MKKHVVINGKKINSALRFNVDYKTVVFLTLLLCGIILGVNISENLTVEWQKFFADIIDRFYVPSYKTEYVTIFARLFLPFAIAITLTYVIGLCGVGIPFIASIPLFSGVFVSVLIPQIFRIYGMQGIGCFVFVYLPLLAIASATIIKSCSNSIGISLEIFLLLATGKGSCKPILKDYTIQHVAYMVLILIFSAISVLLYVVYLKLFVNG